MPVFYSISNYVNKMNNYVNQVPVPDILLTTVY